MWIIYLHTVFLRISWLSTTGFLVAGGLELGKFPYRRYYFLLELTISPWVVDKWVAEQLSGGNQSSLIIAKSILFWLSNSSNCGLFALLHIFNIALLWSCLKWGRGLVGDEDFDGNMKSANLLNLLLTKWHLTWPELFFYWPEPGLYT